MRYFSIKTNLFMLIFVLLICIISNFQSVSAEEFTSAVSDWPPHIIVDSENNNVSGIDIDILREVIDRAGFQLKTRVYPFKRCLMMLEKGESDIVCAILKRPEREDYLHYIEPPYFTGSVKAFYLKKGDGHRLQKYEDLHGMKISIMEGYKYFPQFDTDPKIQKYPANIRVQLFNMLAGGRVDGFIETETVGDYFITKEGFGGQFEKAPFRYEKESAVYIAVSKKSHLADKTSELSRIVTQMLKEGRIDKIKEKYLNP